MYRGSESAVSGLPETVVSTINAINTGTGLAEAGTGLDLSGYNALVGTTAVMTYQAGTRVEKQEPPICLCMSQIW